MAAEGRRGGPRPEGVGDGLPSDDSDVASATVRMRACEGTQSPLLGKCNPELIEGVLAWALDVLKV